MRFMNAVWVCYSSADLLASSSTALWERMMLLPWCIGSDMLCGRVLNPPQLGGRLGFPPAEPAQRPAAAAGQHFGGLGYAALRLGPGQSGCRPQLPGKRGSTRACTPQALPWPDPPLHMPMTHRCI